MDLNSLSVKKTSRKEQVFILFGTLDKGISREKLEKLINHFPKHIQEQILRYKKKESIQASAVGKLLLLQGLKSLYGLDKEVLNQLSYNDFNRPYLRGQKIDFNISHAGSMVICALSQYHRVGVDIEKVRPIRVEDFIKVFTTYELFNIYHSDNQYLEFFSLWTKKEALLKGEGIGLGYPLTQIAFNLAGDEAQLGSNKWYLNPIHISNQYCGWIATSNEVHSSDIDIYPVSY